ncbi:uncharacterized protein LOC119879703 isoform X1 [Canis lupus familiaris]|uniref:uncharacterized protein LOC119879703 isoform X1 n=1 Tax=Canis lupus familiaris TaxID=9615 RepID=UPI0018F7DF49|nr:uncharacterized protein LOC119879703 isoform X1 [Canis lupus familiaris]
MGSDNSSGQGKRVVFRVTADERRCFCHRGRERRSSPQCNGGLLRKEKRNARRERGLQGPQSPHFEGDEAKHVSQQILTCVKKLPLWLKNSTLEICIEETRAKNSVFPGHVYPSDPLEVSEDWSMDIGGRGPPVRPRRMLCRGDS